MWMQNILGCDCSLIRYPASHESLFLFGDYSREPNNKTALKVHGLPVTGLMVSTMLDTENEWAALTQQVFGAVRVVIVVIREMVDSVTAALIDACRTIRRIHVVFRT